MRIWSLHPKYLDRRGLIACWRETLLAQQVLAGGTRGYTHHPQLARFRALDDPLAGIGAYLDGLVAEATDRGYRFDASKVLRGGDAPAMTVTRGQLDHEAGHLLAKLRARSPELAERFTARDHTDPHPLFAVMPGDIEPWERPTPAATPLPDQPRS